jgi:8-oxo-dGTP diphosphatase
MQDVNLCFLHYDNFILLGYKKRGFGAEKYNGIGGKLEPGETIKQAAIRELYEEIGVKCTIDQLDKSAELIFQFPGKPEWNQRVHVFLVKEWEGEPIDSDEMKPEWFKKDNLPYCSMWPDDPLWLPHVLANKKVKGFFKLDLDQKTIHDYHIEVNN